MAAVQQVLDAIGLGPEFAAIKGINVNFFDAGLIAADEMAGQTDSGPQFTLGTR